MVFRSRCGKEVMSHLVGHDAVVLAGQPLDGGREVAQLGLIEPDDGAADGLSSSGT